MVIWLPSPNDMVVQSMPIAATFVVFSTNLVLLFDLLRKKSEDFKQHISLFVEFFELLNNEWNYGLQFKEKEGSGTWSFFKYFRKTTTQRILSRSTVLCQNTVLSHIETPRETLVVYAMWKLIIFSFHSDFTWNQFLRVLRNKICN